MRMDDVSCLTFNHSYLCVDTGDINTVDSVAQPIALVQAESD